MYVSTGDATICSVAKCKLVSYVTESVKKSLRKAFNVSTDM